MVAILVLAIALPLTINLVKKNQENRSKAATDTTCATAGGTCLLYGTVKQAGISCLIGESVKGITNTSFTCDTDKVCCVPAVTQ